ncbi:hypothetical protein pdam_00015878 [Pocillopora damicornis]|uniref:Uncharacterized protein n=1 Tax=Pocillopora damicornis TaxID=46731 RepID=A0A3M6UR96_POCDA|nr:hypothetical protein pdam_00015878 [Pocillopora damicornis]
MKCKGEHYSNSLSYKYLHLHWSTLEDRHQTMGVSFCISVLIVFIWSNLTFGPVQSRSFSGIPDESKLTGQIMVGLCLRRCGLSFQAFNAKIYREELPLDHFCYTKCIGKEGKHNSSVKERNHLFNPHNTPSFERIKRDASNSVKNQTSSNTSVVPNGERIKPTSFNAFGRKWLQKCLMNKPRAEKSFTADDVKVTYEELNNTGRYIATLSWTPFDIQAANWTGYGIIYELLDPFSPSQRVYGLCQELDKNATNFAITNSSYGLKNGSSIAHYINQLHVQVATKKVLPTWQLPSPLHVLLFLYFFCYRLRRPLVSLPDMEFEYHAFLIYSSQDLKCCVRYVT